MHWECGNVRVHHPRQPWGGQGDETTFVQCRLDRLKGTNQVYNETQLDAYQALYNRAKFYNDIESAIDIIERVISDNCIENIADIVSSLNGDPIFIYPYVPFDDEDGIGGLVPLRKQPSNALPFAYAHYLVSRFGGIVNETIIQASRPGRTKLTMWLRFLCQPSFDGEVDHRHPYILVDDVMTTGGTLAMLRSYIVRNGGTVAGTTVLAHKEGAHQKFGIARETLDVLISKYGRGLIDYWNGTTGHDPSTLTDAEARFLALHEWEGGTEPLQRLRERINKAAATGK